MKITCQSCQAKYTIADEKVLGKIVKIRCKKCSATIVVNGSENGAQGAAAGGDDAWTVNVGDGDQRTMTDAEIASAFQSGVINTETFCWKDGMSDWLPLREIDQLFEACNATRAIQAPSEPPQDDATRIQGGGASAGYGNGATNGNAQPAAARRAPGRGPGADLFHGAARAGSEEEVMTSAPVGAPQAYDEPKAAAAATGARNENSVLFSLNALTSKGNDRPPAVPGVEASGLIDIRQLSAQMGKGDDKKKSRVDDIMNLSSGGAFNAALSAPVLAAPALDQYGPPAGADAGASGGKNKGLIYGAVGAGAFVIIAAIGAAVVMMRGGDADKDKASPATAAASATTSAAAAATTGSPAAPEATTAEAAKEAPAASDTAAAKEAPAAAAPATTTAAAAAAPAEPKPAAAAAAPAAPKPVAAAPAAPKPAAAPAESEQPFNMGEAKSRLAAAAAAVQSCKKGDASGTGRVVVVFAPSGGAQSATISGPPFDGTPTGACVAARFKGVHVPPFSGSPFSVSKSFTIN